MNLIKLFFLSILTMILTACGGEGSGLPSQGGDGSPKIVSLQVTPAKGVIPVGLDQQFVAQATLNDGSVIDVTNNTDLTWSSSNTAVATIDNTNRKGLATGVSPGTVTITASGIAGGQSFSATADLTVTNAQITTLQVTPATTTVAVGLEQQFTAMATLSDGRVIDVTTQSALSWSSSNTAVATIDNAGRKGLATGVSPGTVTITASGIASGQSFSATAELTVTNAVITALQITPATTTVAVGLEQQFTAMATLSDGRVIDVTTQSALSWGSSNTAVATIDNADSKGLATGVSLGTVTITASGIAGGQSFSATAELTVTNAVVTALKVTPATTTVAMGLEQQFTAMATLSDGRVIDVTTQSALSWSSSNTVVATVDNIGAKGLATGVSPGTVTITASGIASGQSFSATAELTVTNAVVTALKVTPATAMVAAGLTQQFTAIATLSDGRIIDVTTQSELGWSSDNTDIATIDNLGSKGLSIGVSPGTVTITASGIANGQPFSATAELTVTSAVVTALQVTPPAATIAAGLTQQFTATATLSDGQIVDVSTQSALGWSSSNPAVATIDNAGNKGLSTGILPGTVTITASGVANGQSFSATAELTVTVRATGVVTWGNSLNGGDSSSVQSQLTNVQSLFANGYSFAALHTDGSVTTWGDNAKGGDSSAVQGQLTGVQEIFSFPTLGTAFAALRSDHTVVTWGDPISGGGDSSAVQSQLTNVQTIFSAQMAFAALRTDGSVVTWGNSGVGGNSSAVQSQLTDVQTIASVRFAFAALRGDGAVVAWGDPSLGGDSSAVQSQLTNVKAIFSNESAFAALRMDGTVVTWGQTGAGGDSSSVQSQLVDVTDIASTISDFAALRIDGSVVTWGTRGGGGDSSTVQSQLTNVKKIFSTANSFAALRADGSVVTWGNSTNGGDSSVVQGQLVNVQEIFSNNSAFAALRADGTVVTWGATSSGGNSSAVQSQLTNVQTIFSNSSGSTFAALKADGTVVTWGDATRGGDSSGVQSQLVNVQSIAATMFAFAAHVLKN